jgi:hypothetical protein
VALTIGSTIVAGDWWLAPEPWIGIGLALTVVGLALVAVTAIWLDFVETVGWWRVVALPPALIVLAIWLVMLIGIPTTGPGGPVSDPTAILYTLPTLQAVLVIATLALCLPLLRVRVRDETSIAPVT